VSVASLVSLAAAQYGLVTVAQLRAAGLTGSAVSKRVRRGDLHRVFPRVYAYGHPALSREGLWLAAVFAGGAGAVLSHLSALALLLGIDRFPADVPDVLVPRHTHRRVEGVRFRRCARLDPRDVTTVRGIPVTTVARLLVDLTDLLTPHQLAYVIREAAYRKLLDLRAVHAAAARANGRRNLKVLAEALALYESGSAGTRSPHEDAFLALWPSTAPAPLVNVALAGFEVDFLWPEAMLVVEIDGGGHERPTARRKDGVEDRVLRGAGYTVLRFTDRQLARHSAGVIARVIGELERRGGDRSVRAGPSRHPPSRAVSARRRAPVS
jgi:hypothetical protein